MGTDCAIKKPWTSNKTSKCTYYYFLSALLNVKINTQTKKAHNMHDVQFMAYRLTHVIHILCMCGSRNILLCSAEGIINVLRHQKGMLGHALHTYITKYYVEILSI